MCGGVKIRLYKISFYIEAGSELSFAPSLFFYFLSFPSPSTPKSLESTLDKYLGDFQITIFIFHLKSQVGLPTPQDAIKSAIPFNCAWRGEKSQKSAPGDSICHREQKGFYQNGLNNLRISAPRECVEPQRKSAPRLNTGRAVS
jgi:hypothetical protein